MHRQSDLLSHASSQIQNNNHTTHTATTKNEQRQTNITKKPGLTENWSKHLRAFFRCLASDEPIFFMAHPKVYDHLISFTKDSWDLNTVIPETFSYYSPVIYLLINFTVANGIELPECFYILLNEIGHLAKCMCVSVM